MARAFNALRYGRRFLLPIYSTVGPRNIRVAIVYSILQGLYFGSIFVLWQPFALSLGISIVALGLLETIGGRFGFVAAIVPSIGGTLSDRVGRRRVILAGSGALALAWGFATLASVTDDWRFLPASYLAWGFSWLYVPVFDAWIADTVPGKERSMTYSLIAFAFLVPMAVTTALGGYLASSHGYLPIVALALGLECLGFVILFRWTENVVEGNGTVTTMRDSLSLSRILSKLVPPVGFKGLFVALALDSFVWAVGPSLFFGLLRQSFQYNDLQLGLIGTVFTVTWVLVQLPLGKLIEKKGGKPFLIASEIVGLALVGMWIVAPSFPTFLLSAIIWGLVPATWITAQFVVITGRAPIERRGELLGQLATFRGLITFMGPLLGGLLFTVYGFQGPMLFSLVGIAITALAIQMLI